MTAPYLSIVIPAYNEETRLGKSLQPVLGWLDAQKMAAEVVVVDDGSLDGTAAVAESAHRQDPRVRLVHYAANRGKGAAVREGSLAARGSLILVSDADFSTPIEEAGRLIARMRETASDIVIGSRALPGSRIEVRQPFWRVAIGKGGNRLIRTLTGLPFQDTQCGFKLLDREKIQPVFRKMVVDRFAYDIELLWLAKLAGMRVLEEPVIWRNSPDSRVSALRDPLKVLADVVRLRGRIKRGFYREREREQGS
jgi:dolichyl-phosphate beta-glucosyltransferase